MLHKLPKKRIYEICHRYGVSELAVFGSVLRDDFGPESDVDFLVVFRNNDAGPWATKFSAMEAELSNALGRPVDVVDKIAIEQSDNWMIRKSILDHAQVIYAD
jgi:predicted nucleotidyltransferase